MALKKSQNTSFGIVVQDAYHRIESLRLVNKEKMQFSVCAYADVNAIPFMSNLYSCAYDLTGENPLKQAYAHIKTLSDFDGAVDC
jgi:hypothetical protein